MPRQESWLWGSLCVDTLGILVDILRAVSWSSDDDAATPSDREWPAVRNSRGDDIPREGGRKEEEGELILVTGFSSRPLGGIIDLL